MLHCRMLDGTAQLQQEALGILGVNLVHGALTKSGQHYQVLAGLMDDLDRSRIEVPYTCIYTQHATCRNGLQFMPCSHAMQPSHTYMSYCTARKGCTPQGAVETTPCGYLASACIPVNYYVKGVQTARRCAALSKAPLTGCQALPRITASLSYITRRSKHTHPLYSTQHAPG